SCWPQTVVWKSIQTPTKPYRCVDAALVSSSRAPSHGAAQKQSREPSLAVIELWLEVGRRLLDAHEVGVRDNRERAQVPAPLPLYFEPDFRRAVDDATAFSDVVGCRFPSRPIPLAGNRI